MFKISEKIRLKVDVGFLKQKNPVNLRLQD